MKTYYVKKIRRPMLAIVVVMLSGILSCCTSNSEAERNVKGVVDEVEARCPMRIDELTILEHFVMHKKDVAYQYIVEGDLTTAKVQELKATMKTRLKDGDEQMLAFFGEVVKSGRSLVYEYRDAKGHKVEVTFSNKELSDIVGLEE